ncbi:zinc-binding dehydrogenase [Cellulomonas sp. ATA003]|uniref:zinc-dependent alcohol dehydrogenase n=1 Tax=Cellulomonas sp. ATA003 TaxID=3073064 RepID=UPI002873A7FB|nr:zinc-binding dehydrogenase [Cellulomonas sp. ATA003]WNB86603.1 zinc-binding dehydrogenase [Cellulomonas sp. ATA003]
MTAVGLCGSDLHWFSEGGIGDAQLTNPLVLGHEMAGVVVGGPRDGHRVAIDPAWPCGHCEDCVRGNRNLCRAIRFAGHSVDDGGLRELMAWPDHLLHPVPDSLTDADAAMLEPLGVALHAHDLARPRLAQHVAVIGCGPIGLCLVQLARAGGAAQVIAIEPVPHRRDAAAAMGADLVLDPADPDVEATILAATGGRGVEVAWEAAGTDDAVALATVAAAPGAQVILAGIPGEDTTSFPASIARRKGLTFKVSRRMKEMYPRATSLVERGTVDVRSVVTHTYGLDDVAEAFRVADSRAGLKVVVTPNA